MYLPPPRHAIEAVLAVLETDLCICFSVKDINPRKDVHRTRHTFTLGECAQDGCGTLKCVALAAHHWQGFRRLGRSMKGTLVWRQLCACDCLDRRLVRIRSCHSLERLWQVFFGRQIQLQGRALYRQTSRLGYYSNMDS